jgi:hypothetical protein
LVLGALKDLGSPDSVVVEVWLNDDGCFAAALRTGYFGQEGNGRQEKKPQADEPLAAEDDGSDDGGHEGKDEGEPPDAGDRGEAEKEGHVACGVAQVEPLEAGPRVGVFDSDPQGGDSGGRPVFLRQVSGERREEAGLEGFGEAEEDEEEPGGGGTDSRMVFEGPLNPVAEAEPVDDAGCVAEGEADEPAGFAGGRDQERREGDGGEDGEVVVGEKGDKKQSGEESEEGIEDHWLNVIINMSGDNMIRTQISLDKEEYNLARKEAATLGISIAEFVRRAVREQLPARGEGAWMKYAGFVETGDADSSQSIDEIVYGTKG